MYARRGAGVKKGEFCESSEDFCPTQKPECLDLIKIIALQSEFCSLHETDTVKRDVEPKTDETETCNGVLFSLRLYCPVRNMTIKE